MERGNTWTHPRFKKKISNPFIKIEPCFIKDGTRRVPEKTPHIAIPIDNWSGSNKSLTEDSNP